MGIEDGDLPGGKWGQFRNLTEEHFRLQERPSSGVSILRKEIGFYQFVCLIAV